MEKKAGLNRVRQCSRKDRYKWEIANTNIYKRAIAHTTKLWPRKQLTFFYIRMPSAGSA
jgi:hypothetical protein